MEQIANMIPKKLLIDWQRSMMADLEGLSINYISKKTGINNRTLTKYLTLSGQEVYSLDVIEKINAFRDELKGIVKSLSA